MNFQRKTILAFGEIIWDILPEETVLGGAPLNVAYHLTVRGWPTLFLSRVGSDGLGRETIDRIRQLGLGTDGIQQDGDLPTGQVIVTRDERKDVWGRGRRGKDCHRALGA